MTLQFEDVLSRVGLRSGEVQRNTRIQGLTTEIQKISQNCRSWRYRATEQRLHKPPQSRS